MCVLKHTLVRGWKNLYHVCLPVQVYSELSASFSVGPNT